MANSANINRNAKTPIDPAGRDTGIVADGLERRQDPSRHDGSVGLEIPYTGSSKQARPTPRPS
jgi:hypothetical protein